MLALEILRDSDQAYKLHKCFTVEILHKSAVAHNCHGKTKRNTVNKEILINKKKIFHILKGLLSHKKDLLKKKKDSLTQKKGLLTYTKQTHGKFLWQIATANSHGKKLRQISTAIS